MSDTVQERRAAMEAYLALDARVIQREDDLARATGVWEERRRELGVLLREFVPLAQHIGDPDVYLAPLQATLARSVGLASIIDEVAAELEAPSEVTPMREPASAAMHAEHVVAAGLWLEEHLEDAGWLRADAVRIAAQAHGYSAEDLDAARTDLVATEARATATGEEWRLALEGVFEVLR